MRTRNLRFFLHALVALCLYSAIMAAVLHWLIPQEDSEVEGWKRNESRNVSNYISFTTLTAAIVPEQMKTCPEEGLLWIFVNSAPENGWKRDAIRSSWARLDYSLFKSMHLGLEGKYLEAVSGPTDVQVTFVLGKSLERGLQGRVEREAEVHRDVLQVNTIDHYQNMTLKVIEMLQWASSRCVRKYQFVAKVDDNTFVNVPNMVHVLLGGTLPLYSDVRYFYDLFTIEATNVRNRLPTSQLLMLGDLWNLCPALRNTKYRYYCPTYLHQDAFYPPFLSGYIYIMSQRVVPKLLQVSLRVPMLHLEDVYVTGILAREAGIPRTRSHLLAFNKLKNLCGLKGVIAEDCRDPGEFGEAAKFLSDPSVGCGTMDEGFWKYIYRVLFYALEPWIYIYNMYKTWDAPLK